MDFLHDILEQQNFHYSRNSTFCFIFISDSEKKRFVFPPLSGTFGIFSHNEIHFCFVFYTRKKNSISRNYSFIFIIIYHNPVIYLPRNIKNCCFLLFFWVQYRIFMFNKFSFSLNVFGTFFGAKNKRIYKPRNGLNG